MGKKKKITIETEEKETPEDEATESKETPVAEVVEEGLSELEQAQQEAKDLRDEMLRIADSNF
jgi:hypothetical protein